MRLVEFFLMLEAKNRLEYLANTYAPKIYKKWKQELHNKPLYLLPEDWLNVVGTELPNKHEIKTSMDWKRSFPNMPKWVVRWFSKFDPTRNDKYTDWMLRQWLNGFLETEDAYKLREYLTIFDEHRKNLEKKDINQYKDYRELVPILRYLEGKQPAGEKVKNFLKKDTIQQMMDYPVPDPQKTFAANSDSRFAGELDDLVTHSRSEGEEFDTVDWYGSDWVGVPDTPEEDPNSTTEIEVKYKSDRLAVLIPNTRRAACELGRGSEWCTSANVSHNAFWNYAPEGPLYVILTDKMGKFQFHFSGGGEFRDIHDKTISDDEKEKLLAFYPELSDIFFEEAITSGHFWLLDPNKITMELVNSLFEQIKDGGVASYEVVRGIKNFPQAFDGKVDEEVLLAVEDILRERYPYDAWRYIRIKNLSENDFFAALDAETPYISISHRILNFSKVHNLKLSDELYQALIERDGDSILDIPMNIIERNPEWVFASVKNNPSVIVEIYDTLGSPKSQASSFLTQVRFFHEILATPEGIETVNKVLLRDPKIVKHIGPFLGFEPWKAAFLGGKNDIEIIADLSGRLSKRFIAGRMNFTKRQLNELLVFTLKEVLFVNSMQNSDEFSFGREILRSFENLLDVIPLDIQRLIFNNAPDYIPYLNNPYPVLLKAIRYDEN